MSKKLTAFLSLFSILLFLSIIPAHSATKAGAKCTKVGSKSVVATKTYTCIKSGKKLVWSKGVATNPTPAPTPTPVAYGKYLEIDACKIVDATVNKDVQLITSGFERFTYERFKNPLTMRVIVLPVSFANLDFGTSDLAILKNQNALVSQYFAKNSWGKAKANFVIPDAKHWVSLPGIFQEYLQSAVGRTQGISDFLIEEILSSVNKEVDLTSFDIVAFQTSRSTEFYFASGTMRTSSNAFYSKSGPVKDVFGIGGLSTGDWRVIAHELGHNWLGFEDLYNHFTGSVPLGNWDLMSSLANLELNGWHRWAAGWMQDSQVHCLSKDTSALVQVSPLNSFEKKLLVSIPLQSGKSIFLEYRTSSEYYFGSDTVLVYFVDTTIWHGSGPYKLVAELQKKGDSILFENQTIRLYEKFNNGVYVAVNS
jgi:M6 family metalloprotease-like protein